MDATKSNPEKARADSRPSFRKRATAQLIPLTGLLFLVGAVGSCTDKAVDSTLDPQCETELQLGKNLSGRCIDDVHGVLQTYAQDGDRIPIDQTQTFVNALSQKAIDEIIETDSENRLAPDALTFAIEVAAFAVIVGGILYNVKVHQNAASE